MLLVQRQLIKRMCLCSTTLSVFQLVVRLALILKCSWISVSGTASEPGAQGSNVALNQSFVHSEQNHKPTSPIQRGECVVFCVKIFQLRLFQKWLCKGKGEGLSYFQEVILESCRLSNLCFFLKVVQSFATETIRSLKLLSVTSFLLFMYSNVFSCLFSISGMFLRVLSLKSFLLLKRHLTLVKVKRFICFRHCQNA